MNYEKKLQIKYLISKSNITKVSGAIGLTILSNKKLNKKVYLFFDDHSNKKYCSGDINFLNIIYSKLEKKFPNILFLLEEPFISSESKVRSLWNDSTHIINFRKHYTEAIKKCNKEKICHTFPIDIRLCLFDVSIEEIVANYDNQSYFEYLDYLTPNYFRNILYLFDFINLKDFIELSKLNGLDVDILTDSSSYLNNLLFLKKVFSIFVDSTYYMQLKKSVYILYLKYIVPNKNIHIKDFIKTNKDDDYSMYVGFPWLIKYNGMLDLYDKIINGIMELYTLILTNYFNVDTVIINCGFYHSINLKYILINFYDYQIEYEVGITTLKPIESNIEYKNCIEIDNKYL